MMENTGQKGEGTMTYADEMREQEAETERARYAEAFDVEPKCYCEPLGTTYQRYANPLCPIHRDDR